MRTIRHAALILGLLLPVIDGAAAYGDGVAVKITNDGTEDVIVTVYDTSTRPYRAVLVGARINGFASVPVSLLTDATGKANIAWTATSVDANNPRCGHASKFGLADAAAVNVYADSNCNA
jgi:hypothetical protein